MASRYFTKQEKQELIWDYEVEEIVGSSHRWETEMTTIVYCEDDNKYYAIDWMKGNTEYQENEIWDGECPEVKKVKKIVEIEKWIPVEDK